MFKRPIRGLNVKVKVPSSLDLRFFFTSEVHSESKLKLSVTAFSYPKVPALSTLRMYGLALSLQKFLTIDLSEYYPNVFCVVVVFFMTPH